MSGVLSAIGIAAFKLAFQISPIFLTNGIATQIGGQIGGQLGGLVSNGALPIVALTEASNFVLNLISGSSITLDSFFAHWQPLPGSTLLDLQIGTYPFANQTVAANATISQPLTLSYLMRCPARGAAGYLAKLGTMVALQSSLTQHAQLGGTYTCITPSAFYPNGILTSVRDVSDAQSHQVQNAYQFDFTFPLLTQEQAQAAQSSLMGKLTSQTMLSSSPSWSGTGISSPSLAGF